MRFNLQFSLSDYQLEHLTAMQRGLDSLGIEHHSGQVRPGEKVACWGWRTGAKWRQRGHDVLVLERGYIGDRFAWTSLAWNGLNGRGTAPAIDDDGERFRKHHAPLGEWRTDGEYVLICGQVPGDASLQGRDLNPWYAEQVAKHKGERIIFRPHPLAARRGGIDRIDGAETSTRTLKDDLRGARKVVTYNSNSGVDAWLAGRYATCENEGSMIYGLQLKNREQWAHRLAWRQWTIDEIADGTALGVLIGV